MSPVACPTVHILGEYVPRMHRLELTIVLMMVVVVVDIPLFFCFFLYFLALLFCEFFTTKKEMYLIFNKYTHGAQRDQILHKSTMFECTTISHFVLSRGKLLVFVDANSMK